MELTTTVLDWMLDSDPSLRWRVERDLVGEPDDVWRATRSRVAGEGFGARLLALQDADGQWAGGAYFPGGTGGDHVGEADDPMTAEEEEALGGQPWTATTWSLNTLRDWGVEASALAGTAEALERSSRWEYDDLPYWDGEVDVCINAFTLANGVWLGADVTGIARWFVDHRLPDGGWNCEWVEGSTRSSFHSTLNALKGILAYEQAEAADPDLDPDPDLVRDLRAARHAGEQYLLDRRLLHRLSTGELVGPWATRFAHPFRAWFTVLNAATYFRDASLFDGTPPDPRLSEAIDIIRSAQRPDGTWAQGARYAGRVWFETDAPVGESSKWLTFHSTAVLTWWDAATRS